MRASTDKQLSKILCVENDRDIESIIDMSLSLVPNVELKFVNKKSHSINDVIDFSPEIILLDDTSTLNGVYDTIKSHSETKDIGIVVSTTKPNAYASTHFEDLDVCGVIQKPFDVTHLYSGLNSIWQKNIDASLNSDVHVD